jgi:signal transduction histidine kinase
VLAALAINLGILEIEKDSLSPTAAELLSQSSRLVQNLLQDVRGLSHLLYPPTLDEMGVASAIHWYVERFMERSPVQVTLDIPDDLGRLPRDVEVALFRVVQESLSNVHRHSGSLTATVHVSRSSRGVSVEIRDRGKGIPAEIRAAAAKVNGKTGMGISGMRERVRQLGGNVLLDSNHDGSLVSASFPLADQVAD